MPQHATHFAVPPQLSDIVQAHQTPFTLVPPVFDPLCPQVEWPEAVDTSVFDDSLDLALEVLAI